MRFLAVFIIGVCVGLLAHAYTTINIKREVVCESGEEIRIYEDYTLWVSPCRLLDTDTLVMVRMID